MKLRILTTAFICISVIPWVALSAFGEEFKPIQLPGPRLETTKSLEQALKERKTTREYDTADISFQVLSNLLWAACGINRPDSGRRTAPSARNWQEIDVYVSTSRGTYLYDPKANTLRPVVPGDLRSLTYTQADRFKDAPLHLVYVADLEKTGEGEEALKMPMVAMDTGFVAQNVYLYCASEGLATAYRVSIDKARLADAIKLRPTQRIMGAQSIGFPVRR